MGPFNFFWAFATIFFLSFVSINAQNPPTFRLPRSLIPTNYTLEIISVLDDIPQFTRFTAPGKVWISVNCTESTRSITLHVLDLDIEEDGVYVHTSEGLPLAILNFSFVQEYDFFVINLSEDLNAGQNYVIFVPYTAPISDTRLDGIYLDSYVDPANNETKYVSTTLFAANAARRAFPCFDEPHLKAVFNVRIGRHDKYHSLSNTQVVENVPLPEMPSWSIDIFAPTPQMSTYLVCMIVSDLKFTEVRSTPTSVSHRVYAPYYFIEAGGGNYSANLSLNALSFFESYYNLSFPLQKLDNVALPQFYFNAMENWGLMTYADRALLYFEGETPAAQKYSLSLTVSHEVSHNFFGNAVTCKWWTWIWLNEGFATFVSHQGLNYTHPELRPWEMFVPQIYQVGMDTDESVATHPIASEPLTAQAVGGIYDRIVYEKAASVIRMTEAFLTQDILQEGVRRYLKQWEFSVTEQDDLFSLLQQVVDERDPSVLPPDASVKSILDTWTLQSGYPLLTLEPINSTHMLISQEQFVQNGIPLGNESWWVPVQFQVLGGPLTTFWMRNDEKNMTLEVAEGEVIFINPESIGYFRVLYGDVMLQRLSLKLQFEHIQFSPIMRAKLLDDSFALAFAGKLSINSALDMTKYLSIEVDHIVWKCVSKHLLKLVNALSGTVAGDLFRDYILSKVTYARKTTVGHPLNINVELLHHELDQLLMQLSPQTRQMWSKEEIQLEIDNYLSAPHLLAGNFKPTSVKDEIIAKLGKDALIRRNTFEVLKERLQNNKQAKERSFFVLLLKSVCGFGNNEQDLDAVQQIASNFSSTTEMEKKSIQVCIHTIKKNMELKENLTVLVKSWVIKR